MTPRARDNMCARENGSIRFQACGMTLIELLVATLILSVLMLAVLRTYEAGRLAGRRVDERLPAIEAGTRFLDNLRAELLEAHNPTGDEAEAGFHGQETSLRFHTASRATESIGPRGAFSTRIEYSLGTGQASPRQRNRVMRRMSRVTVGSRDGTAPNRATTVLHDVRTLHFRYFGAEPADEQPAWHRTWRARSRLPRAVSVFLVLEHPTGSDLSPLRLRTTMTLPLHAAGRDGRASGGSN